MRVAINLLPENPEHPSGAHWFWTRMIPEMAKRLESGEELHLLVSPKSRHLHQGYGPDVFYITYPWSNERRSLRTLSEHLYSPLRLPLSRIDVFNTLMAPLVNVSWSLVIHMKTMHAFTAPESLTPLARAYRRMNYPRSARVADAIIINSESLRSEIQRYLEVDARKLKLIYEAVDHDLFKPGDADEARARRRVARRDQAVRALRVLAVAVQELRRAAAGVGAGPWLSSGDRQLADRRRRARREIRCLAALARGRARYRRGRGLRGRSAARGDRPLLPGGRLVRVPVAQRDLRAAHPGGHGLRLPGRDLGYQRHAGDRRGSRGPGRPQGSSVDRPGHRRGGRAGKGSAARPGAPASRPVHLGGDGRGDPRCVPRGRRTPAAAAGNEDPRHRRRRVHRIAHLRPAPVARTRRRRARRADPAGPPERAACLPECRSRLLPGRHPQPRSGHEPAAARGRRLSLRRLPGLPARLLHGSPT